MESGRRDVVVLYPDFLGRGLAPEGFADRVLEAGFHPVALVNGPPGFSLSCPPRADVTVVVSPMTGLAPSLPFGYRACLPLADVVVRIDTAENPLDRVGDMAAAAVEEGAAVGDLVFGPLSLVPGTADEHSQLDVFPLLFHRMTGGALSLSGTHGFQAWRHDVLSVVLPAAEGLWAGASRSGPLLWGFDAAMAAASVWAGVVPRLVPCPATEVRDRPREKIAEQFDAVLRVLMCYRDLQGSLPRTMP